MRSLVYFIALLFFSTSSANASRIELFTGPRTPSLYYEQEAARVHSGDEVVFSGGKTYKIVKMIGHGETAEIYQTDQDTALRIAKKTEDLAYIDAFVKTRKLLTKVPDSRLVDIIKYQPGEFVEVSLEKKITDLNRFIDRPHFIENTEEAWSDLVELAKDFALYSRVGDFRSDQLIWNGTSWKLIDYAETLFMHHTSDAIDVIDPHVFRLFINHIPQPYRDEIRNGIRETRRNHGLPNRSLAGALKRKIIYCNDVLLLGKPHE